MQFFLWCFVKLNPAVLDWNTLDLQRFFPQYPLLIAEKHYFTQGGDVPTRGTKRPMIKSTSGS
jgi:hypothetical protein